MRLARALLPLRAVSEDLHERAVAYVLSGDPEDVVEHVWQESETDALFGGVGELNRGLHVSDDLADRLSAVGVAWPSDMREPLKDRRRVLYALRDSLYRHDALSAQQWWRYGQLLHAIWAADTPGKKDWRRKPLTPLWLLLLNEDVVKTVAPWEEKAVDMAKKRPTWVPETLRRGPGFRWSQSGQAPLPGTDLVAVETLVLSRRGPSSVPPSGNRGVPAVAGVADSCLVHPQSGRLQPS